MLEISCWQNKQITDLNYLEIIAGAMQIDYLLIINDIIYYKPFF